MGWLCHLQCPLPSSRAALGARAGWQLEQALLLFPIEPWPSAAFPKPFPVWKGLVRAHRARPGPRASQGPPKPVGGLVGQEGHVGLAPMGFGASTGQEARSNVQR